MPEHWRYPFLPTASVILEDVNLESLLEDYFYAEARALAISRLETSATRGIIDIEGPPTNDENDIVLGYVISRLVLAATDNQALVNYVALSEAIRAEAHLSSETDEDLVNLLKILSLAKDLDIQIENGFILLLILLTIASILEDLEINLTGVSLTLSE